MHRTTILLLATAALAVAAPASALARPLSVHGTLHLVSATGDGHYVVRGPVESRGLGRGEVTYTSTVTGEQVRGTVVARFAHGTVRTSMRGRFVLAPQGDVLGTTTGTGRITGATGAYAGATGRFRFTGTSHTDGSTDMVLEGRVRRTG